MENVVIQSKVWNFHQIDKKLISNKYPQRHISLEGKYKDEAFDIGSKLADISFPVTQT